jgi:WD40-like Beta Propeller Repeat
MFAFLRRQKPARKAVRRKVSSCVPHLEVLEDRTMPSISAVSLALNGETGNGFSGASQKSLSVDGRYVVFESYADNLVSGDTNGVGDIFVSDRQTGMIERVSVGPGGIQGNGRSTAGVISGDGRYVAFISYADNLVSGDTNGGTDVFVRDRQSGVTERVNLGPGGIQSGGQDNFGVAISRDGRYVAFKTDAPNLSSDGTTGPRPLYVHDRQTGMTELISYNPQSFDISGDGRYVAFAVFFHDVFVYDRQTATTQRVSLGLGGVEPNQGCYSPTISGDGRYVVYYSDADNLVSGDTNGTFDVFVFDRQTTTTDRVSVGPGGIQGNGVSWRPTISDDGRYVAFDSDADNIVNGDTNNARDVFLYDRQSGMTRRLSVAPASAEANDDSDSPAVSADGSYVVFNSLASNLAAGDVNNARDVFIASLSVNTSVTLAAANATYTGLAYDTANLITTVTPGAASGSVSYVFYSDAGGQNAIATPINAGTYYVQAFFTSSSSGYTDGTSGIVSFNIAKANASFSVTPYSGTYDGLAHNITVVATGVGSDGDLSSLVTLGSNQTNAGSYTGTWSFAGNGNYNPASGTAAIVITAKSLTVDATTQGTLNIAKAGTISFALQITGGLIASNNDIAALFNGAVFTIVVDGTSYSLTSTATVALDGRIYVSMKMSQGLQNALLTVLSEGNTVDFSLSALSNDDNYSLAADAISRLISEGKLKFAVV